MKPRRIQRQRVRGWRKPPNTVMPPMPALRKSDDTAGPCILNNCRGPCLAKVPAACLCAQMFRAGVLAKMTPADLIEAKAAAIHNSHDVGKDKDRC